MSHIPRCFILKRKVVRELQLKNIKLNAKSTRSLSGLSGL